MPIHEKLRGRDAPTIHNYLRVTMCNIHDELIKRVDVPAVADSLRGQIPPDPGLRGAHPSKLTGA
jgi:hypothetical protein